jgi:MOSC domain-containing protein YiiM
VVAVARSPRHRFSKDVVDAVTLIEAHGVEGDGTLARLVGVMAVVRTGGEVRAGDAVVVELPEGEAVPLKPL